MSKYARIILDLKNKHKNALEQAEILLNAGDKEGYKTQKALIDGFNEEIANYEFLDSQNKPEPASKGIQAELDPAGESEAEAQKTIDEMRSDKTYVNAFVDAIKMGASVKKDKHNTALAPLYNALTVGGGTPEGASGGFLVPIDIDNTIIEEMRQFLDISVYFNNETVTTMTGWRVVDTTPTLGFTAVDEMAAIARDDQPEFGRVEYAVKKYGLIVPISNELLDDNAANLMAYLGRWFAKKLVITNNAFVLNLLKSLTPVTVADGGEIDALKNALDVTLDPDISVNSRLITNQSGFNKLNKLKDANGLPMFQPNVINRAERMFDGRPITIMADRLLPNVGGRAPAFIGDYRQFGTLFSRKPLEVVSTDIAGDAFETDSTMVRGLTRKDAQIFDKEAATYLTIAI